MTNGQESKDKQSELVRSNNIIENESNFAELSNLFDTVEIETEATSFAILSDIHSNYPAFEAVLEELEDLEYDATINLGDFVGYYTQPNQVVEKSMRIFDYSVMGNHDFAAIEPKNMIYLSLQDVAKVAIDHNKDVLTPSAKNWLAKLPLKAEIYTPEGSLTLVHGDPVTIFGYIWGKNTDLMKKEIERSLEQISTDYLLVGHTHIQGFHRGRNGKTYLNPGAVGQPRDKDPRAAFAILDLKEGENGKARLRRVEYDINEVTDKVRQCNFPDYLGKRLSEGI